MTSAAPPKILVVDDEINICRSVEKILVKVGIRVRTALNGQEALSLLAAETFDAVLTDLKMSRLGGMEVLQRAKEIDPRMPVIVMTGYASVSSAVEVMKLGAVDYLPKPFTPDEIRAVVRQALAAAQTPGSSPARASAPPPRAMAHQLIGDSSKIRQVIAMVAKVAPTDSTVLVGGESGTGKELIARAIHANSRRKDEVFFAVDCATLSTHLLESELFGHTRGAFTGAERDKAGIFQLADHGTVFLDEIGNISLDVQGKLLRFLETREFWQLGAAAPRRVDVRLIFATNKNLESLVAAGAFREDFYYRIFVYPILLPPLRERRTDILPIAEHFLRHYSSQMNKMIRGIDSDVVRRLEDYDWPGNVRQLRNVIERAVILCEGDRLTADDLDLPEASAADQEAEQPPPRTKDDLKRLKKAIRRTSVNEVEKSFLLQALAQNGWNVTRASKATGLQRTNFQNLLKKHGIRVKRPPGPARPQPEPDQTDP
jgi:DNA-binding NtrC family response regulator